MKLITFTVPCYNSEDYMHICIDSLLKGGEKVEIIIIDDGSKDRTGAIADSYAAKFPSIVKVVHQENGGHGEGINQGLKRATGRYFKVVDSDDWADEKSLHQVIHTLEQLETKGGVDLLVCNYAYYQKDEGITRVIRYQNALPENRIFTWNETRRFRVDQYLTLHSCMFRTQILRDSGLVLPKHTFYEDNLFVYTPLPLVKTLYYLNVNFYNYLIGREGQSMAVAAQMQRCDQQMTVSVLIFKAHDLNQIKQQNKALYRYMYHECSFMITAAIAFTRLNNTQEHDTRVVKMWQELYAYNPQMAKQMHRNILNRMASLNGAFGRWLIRVFYKLAHKIVKFN